MRKVTLAALAAVLCVLVGSPAMAQAEVTKEPTTFFTSAPFCFPEDDLIEIQGVATSTILDQGTKLIRVAIVANRAIGQDSGQVYHVSFGFSGVFPPGGGVTSTDRMTMSQPGGPVLISRVISVVKFVHGELQIDFENRILRCVGQGS